MITFNNDEKQAIQEFRGNSSQILALLILQTRYTHERASDGEVLFPAAHVVRNFNDILMAVRAEPAR